MKALIFKSLPPKALHILSTHNASHLLIRHHILVYNIGIQIIENLQKTWPKLSLNTEEIQFGTAIHDIGKAIETTELYQKGNKHENIGYQILLNEGISDQLSRFAKTHGNWENKNLELEDLIVALSDKIWKGKRINELEERISEEISKKINSEYWDVYLKLDAIFSRISIGADERLNWQNKE
jgi:uncharacterized protein YutD